MKSTHFGLTAIIAWIIGLLMALTLNHHATDDTAFITLVRDNQALRSSLDEQEMLVFSWAMRANSNHEWCVALSDRADSLQKALAKCESARRDTLVLLWPDLNHRTPPVTMPVYTPAPDLTD